MSSTPRRMNSFPQIDLSKVKTISIKNRKSKVRAQEFAQIFDPENQDFAGFIKSLPDILIAKDLRQFVEDVVRSRKKKKPFVVMMGAHVVKVGLSPLIIDLIHKKIITAVAMNSAAVIHDVETAMWGTTSEDVEANLQDGTFGMSKDTGDFINNALCVGWEESTAGYGETIGRVLRKAPNKSLSILATCVETRTPVTVHAAIGTDIIHQQPTMNGAATGELSFRDFKVLCDVVKGLSGAGVVMNIGSAVILPEVFLKALTVVRNLGHNARGFTTANFDMLQHYRPRMNVVSRPTKNSGRGYLFTGHHEIMVPLVFAMIKDRMRARR